MSLVSSVSIVDLKSAFSGHNWPKLPAALNGHGSQKPFRFRRVVCPFLPLLPSAPGPLCFLFLMTSGNSRQNWFSSCLQLFNRDLKLCMINRCRRVDQLRQHIQPPEAPPSPRPPPPHSTPLAPTHPRTHWLAGRKTPS